MLCRHLFKTCYFLARISCRRGENRLLFCVRPLFRLCVVRLFFTDGKARGCAGGFQYFYIWAFSAGHLLIAALAAFPTACSYCSPSREYFFSRLRWAGPISRTGKMGPSLFGCSW